jgi:1-acyl-sn-glycerol-3-phosphate acyltransferase
MNATQLEEKPEIAKDPAACTLENEETIATIDATPTRLLAVRTRIPASMPSRLLHRNVLRSLVFGIRRSKGISIRVEGLDKLDDLEAPFIIAPNHVSLLDSPILHINLPRRHARRTAVVGGLDFFAPREGAAITMNLFRRLVVRFIRGAVNVALINRSGGDYSNLEQIDELLSQGWSLIIFPEATRSRSGELGRMRLGVAELARRYGCPVLPTHISGTDVVLPVGSNFPVKGSIEIRIGEPLKIEEDENSRAFIERLGRQIVAQGTGEQSG